MSTVDTDWRATHARRLNTLGIQRPAPPPVYRRLTDDEIEALPPQLQPMARLARAFRDGIDDTVIRMVESTARGRRG